MRSRLIIIAIFLLNSIYGQTHSRKTRSDKGGHHHHSTEYYAKHGYGSSSTSNKSSTNHSTSNLSSRSTVHSKTSKHPHKKDSVASDSIKVAITTTVSTGPTLEEMRNSRCIKNFIIGGGIVVLLIIISVLISRKKK